MNHFLSNHTDLWRQAKVEMGLAQIAFMHTNPVLINEYFLIQSQLSMKTSLQRSAFIIV